MAKPQFFTNPIREQVRDRPAVFPQTTCELRTVGGVLSALIAAVKSAVAGMNRGVSMESTTLAMKVDESISRERLISGFFGGLALLLASIGLYVMSHNVARRRNEIAIRMALGGRVSC